MAYRVVSGPDPRIHPRCGFLPKRPGSGGRLRIGWFSSSGRLVDPEVAATVEECAALLAEAGYDVVPRKAPYDVNIVRSVWGALSSAGAARAAEVHPDRWRDEASPAIKAAAERGLRLSAVDHVRALDGLAEIRGRVADAWGDVDLFLCPSAASPAWPLEDEFPASIAGRSRSPGRAERLRDMGERDRSSGAQRSGSCPSGRATARRATGGRFGREDPVFEAARRLDRAASWRRPPFPAW